MIRRFSFLLLILTTLYFSCKKEKKVVDNTHPHYLVDTLMGRYLVSGYVHSFYYSPLVTRDTLWGVTNDTLSITKSSDSTLVVDSFYKSGATLIIRSKDLSYTTDVDYYNFMYSGMGGYFGHEADTLRFPRDNDSIYFSYKTNSVDSFTAFTLRGIKLP